jgi:hypothetical protein
LVRDVSVQQVQSNLRITPGQLVHNTYQEIG